MATRTFRLVFEMTVNEPGEAALPEAEDIRNVVEACCPEAMVNAIQDWIDNEDTDMSGSAEDSIVLRSAEVVEPAGGDVAAAGGTKVRIERRIGGEEEGRTALAVRVDGALMGGGGIGGEPEDNSERRDYRWIRPLISALAKRLGAEVETVVLPDEDD